MISSRQAMISSQRRQVASSFVLLVVGGAAIAGAWSFQLIGGYVPCALCLSQRIPYYVGLPVAAVALLAALMRLPRGVSRLLLLVAAAIFAYGFVLAVYQAGAEWKFWEGPTDCGGGTAAVTSAGALLSQLQTTRVVSCTEAAFRLLGLSFAGWNAVASAFLVAVGLYGAGRGN